MEGEESTRTNETPVIPGTDLPLFPGFKIPPIDPARRNAGPALTITMIGDDQDTESDDDEDADEYCARCGNSGVTECFCGGDMCVCENYGEAPCPNCLYRP